ncbi:MAG: SUMF1/EgtB/PvdO family nonheme iron enzyme [Acidobacteria bacterium]|nr:SUMF1/EgtB/PvdO family nonheme iron enzyme [Acidobacteriota bacterium]
MQRPGRRVGGIVRAWGCNGPVVEEGLGLDRSSRRQIQRGLQAGGFDPGGADGLFGPRTRAAIRNWQMSRGSRATGYLDGAAAEALRTAGASSSAVAQVVRPGSTVATAAPPPASPAGTASPPVSAELDGLFWQSIMNSTNPADFEAYLQQFPTGVFRALAQNRLTTLRGPAEGAAPLPGARVGVAESPGDGRPVTGATAAFGGTAGGGDAGLRPRQVFRDCEECPEMVVVPAGSFRMGCVSGQDCDDRECPVHEVRGPSFALGRYEVLFEEYDRFVAATGRENSTTGAGAGAAVR